ncbi:VanZ family protein [Aeromicrobium fastidiosum]|uniref:VanZ family protein n=1 Tax=Aeromicrobium fastidiosum TaxID=52699 RepID=A0A641AQT6_9ACTN|nr:VanZ family protein [Aeromicrobium fastidiosum]KAA1380466.1 VanZ family protein [Aeromicrobium fastidiosum]MBP2390048.1 glycopeptide antibiotics resistance protein [Aeromicrobium fastidiosum]
MRSRRLVLATGLYAVALALIGLWKTPVDRGVPVTDFAPVRWMTDLLDLQPWQAYDLVETSANVVLFVPLGVLVLLWFRHWSWLAAVGVAFATTVTIELLQQALRPERFASLNDVMANTLGGLIGGLLVVGARAMGRRSGDEVVSDHRAD